MNCGGFCPAHYLRLVALTQPQVTGLYQLSRLITLRCPAMKEPVNEIYLQPGEYFWGGERNRVKTLLGSCVAICIWHPRLKIGGMSHCLLPSRGHGGPRVGERTDAPEATGGHGGPRVGERTDAELSGKYVDECLEIFFREMARAGTRKQDLCREGFRRRQYVRAQRPFGRDGRRAQHRDAAELCSRAKAIAIAAQHHGRQGAPQRRSSNCGTATAG
jgi:chemotaxis protein CheD